MDTSQLFCLDVASNFPRALVNRGVEQDCKVIYTGGGFWFVELSLNESTYLQASESGLILCSKDTDEGLAILEGELTPQKMAKKMGEVWSYNQ
jgi:hypothetical protein